MKFTHLITPEKPVLVLRVCQPDGSSSFGFKWPLSGHVSCPDWVEDNICGNGLHGWIEGEGNSSSGPGSMISNPDSLWLVVEVPAYINLKGKIKFSSGTVVFAGTKLAATNYLQNHGCKGTIIGATVVTGEGGVSNAGDWGTAITGNFGTAIAGHSALALVGHYGHAEVACRSTAIGGDNSIAKGEHYCTITVGNHGIATGGPHSIVTVGKQGIAKVGSMGSAKAGIGGQIQIAKYIEYSVTKGTIGITLDAQGSVLEPDVFYVLDSQDNFTRKP